MRQKLSKLNGFKCNLHVIVNFASQAETLEKNISDLDCADETSKFTYYQSIRELIRASC